MARPPVSQPPALPANGFRRRDPAPSDAPGVAEPAEVEAVEDPPAGGRAALVAWATRNGVLGLLRGYIDLLGDIGDLPESLMKLADRTRASTLGDALLLAEVAAPRQKTSRASVFAREARAFLCDEIRHARAASPLAGIPALPDDPTFRDFARRLLDLRARVRDANAPSRRPYDFTFEILDRASIIVVHLSRGRGDSLAVHLRFERDFVASCECIREVVSSCQHVLAAIDALFVAMNDPRADKLRVSLTAALRAPWQRAFGDLDAILAGADPAAAPTRAAPSAIGWRLKRVRHGFRLVPCLMTNGRVKEVRRYEMYGPPWRPIDHAVMSLLDSYGHSTNDLTKLAAALELLDGDPHLVYAEGKLTRPLVLERARVELCGDAVEDGLRLSLALGGRPLADEELAHVPMGGGTVMAITTSAADASAVVQIGTIGASLARAWSSLTHAGKTMPAAELDRFARLAPRLAQALPVRLPESLLGRALPGAPRAVLRLEARGDDGLAVAALVRVHPAATAFPPGDGPRDVFVVHEGERCHVRRDLEAEAAWVAPHVASLGLPALSNGNEWDLAGDEALDLIARLDEPAVRAGIDLEWATAERQVLSAGALRVEVREKRDWFGLSGGLDVGDEQVALAELLAALRAGRRYVRVSGERWVELGETLRRQLSAVTDLTAASGATLELPAMAAPLLEDALGEALQEAPLRWRELIARARAAAIAPPTTVPALGVELRDYQVAGFEWMSRLAAWGAGACLADDMGLGKTIQALAVLAARASLGPALVIAPTSVGWNWVREAERCTPGLRTILFARSEREPLIAAAGPGDVIVASYGLVVRHAEAFASRRFATLVLDEAHALKNAATRRAQVATALQADFKLALTGTPLENRLTELWSLFRVIAPGLLGGLDRFRERFAVPIERDRDDSRRAALARLTRPFLLRRLKREVARELPPRTEVQVDVTLARAERSLYDAIRVQAAQALAGELGGDKRFAVLAALTRLRQAACDVGLLDASITTPSSKLVRLVELVDELRQEGHRVLVFSQFTSLLERARAAVAASGATCLYLDGSTPEARRAALVDDFQAGRGDAFFISLKAGGAGLNLTGADNVIHLDPWWNPAVEDQASDRAHRIGQERPVTVYRLVATGTVEESILKMHADKRALVAGVLEGAAGAAALDAAQLVELLGASSEIAFDDEPGEAAERPDVAEPDTAVAAAEPAARPAPAPNPLVSAFREHLVESGSKPSTAAAYSSAVARWLAARSPKESPRTLAKAALGAANAPDGALPQTTRAALRRLSTMLTP